MKKQKKSYSTPTIEVVSVISTDLLAVSMADELQNDDPLWNPQLIL